MPGAVLMKIEYSGICGTDKHTFTGHTDQYTGSTGARSINYPVICGHENVGVVAAIGPGAPPRDQDGRPLRVGDRILPAPNLTCGRCYYCQKGFPYYFCLNIRGYGNTMDFERPPHLFGGWAEYIYLLPDTAIFTVPDDLPSSIAVLTEPMAVTHGLDAARSMLSALIPSGSTQSVVIIGVGPLGACHLIRCALAGLGPIIAIDQSEFRLELAQKLGANLTLNIQKTTEPERLSLVRGDTGGVGADIVIDCSGNPSTFRDGLQLVRPGGALVEVGAFVDTGPTAVNPAADICTRNVLVLGVGGERLDYYGKMLALLADNTGKYPLDEVVTHQFPLDEAASAMSTALSGRAMKVVFRP
jgi:L-iditol 2-dehydrogenase